MRKLLFLFLACISSLAIAQHPGFNEINDFASFKNKFTQESSKIQSISSNFEQEKDLSILSEKITSNGKFWFQRENKIRIEYVTPFNYLMIIDGDKIFIKDDDNETTLNVKSNKLFQQVNNIMVESVNGTIIDNKDFSVKIFENQNEYLMEMTPVDKTLKEFFNTINIIAEKKRFIVTTIKMNERSGDTTIIKFLDQKLNSSIPNEVFGIN